MVEQFGVTWQFSRFPKVVDGAHDAFTEEIFPNAVDHDSRSERMLRIGDPLGEFKPAGMAFRNFVGCSGLGGDGEETPRDLGSFVTDLAADVDVPVCDRLGFGRLPW